MRDPVYGLLGLCMKAGKALSGNEQVVGGLKKGKGKLLIIASDAAPNTQKEYALAAERRQIPYMIFGKKEILGQALGKSVRTAVLITDKGFGEALVEKLKENI